MTIKNLTSEVNRQSLMIGYINSFKLFAIVSFLTIPFLFLIKVKNNERNNAFRWWNGSRTS